MALPLITVVVADDSATARQLLRLWLTPEHGFQIVGEAENGKECLDLVLRLRPGIVVMDVDMPVMNGLESTREIMRQAPTPILIFTSSTIARERGASFAALAAGALDVFHKPLLAAEAQGPEVAKKFRRLLRLLAPIKMIRRFIPRADAAMATAPVTPHAGFHRILAIASSTGGPMALVRALKPLPPTFPLCTLLVQHMSEEFMPGFVEWLAQNIHLPVKMAAEGDALRPAVVLVAPGGRHMRLGPDGRVRLDGSAPVHSCRPSADVLFDSVAAAGGSKAIGVLLTGMGEDGARGLLRMKQSGALTVAQDEASCIVYGMPKAAVDLGAADSILDLDEIGPFLVSRVCQEGRR